MKHLIIVDSVLKGREYGSLNSFHSAILKVTMAETIVLPELSTWEKLLIQASRWRFLRKFIRKRNIGICDPSKYDVLWYVLMGPENYRLDMFYGYEKIPTKIIYFFDTLPHQFNLIRLLDLNVKFRYKITSFKDAVFPLEKLTKYNWHYFAQASNQPKSIISLQNKTIAFCSYGRSNEKINNAIKEFCHRNSLHFDHTHETQGELLSSNLELYDNYLWHTSQCVFNICFAVEFTHPERAGFLSPVTCRWFEAILSRNIVLGVTPKSAEFDSLFPSNFVQFIDINSSHEIIYDKIRELWERRADIYDSIYKNKKEEYFEKFTWEFRVNEICNSLLKCAEL